MVTDSRSSALPSHCHSQPCHSPLKDTVRSGQPPSSPMQPAAPSPSHAHLDDGPVHAQEHARHEQRHGVRAAQQQHQVASNQRANAHSEGGARAVPREERGGRREIKEMAARPMVWWRWWLR